MAAVNNSTPGHDDFVVSVSVESFSEHRKFKSWNLSRMLFRSFQEYLDTDLRRFLGVFVIMLTLYAYSHGLLVQKYRTHISKRLLHIFQQIMRVLTNARRIHEWGHIKDRNPN